MEWKVIKIVLLCVGQALGQFGLNMNDFCKAFNAETQKYKEETPIPTHVVAYADRTFTFKTKTPRTSWLLMQCAGIEKGSDKPGQEIAGEVSMKHIYEIAKIKQTDEHLNHIELPSLCRSIISSAKSIGVAVKGKGY